MAILIADHDSSTAYFRQHRRTAEACNREILIFDLLSDRSRIKSQRCVNSAILRQGRNRIDCLLDAWSVMMILLSGFFDHFSCAIKLTHSTPAARERRVTRSPE